MSIDKVGYPVSHQPMVVGGSQTTQAASGVPDNNRAEVSSLPKDAVSGANVDKAISAANERLEMASTTIRFSKDDESGKTIIKMVDKTTNQVIRQFPSEEMLRITHALDKLQGVVLNQKA
jgi:flagellar protein FlaG